VALVIQRASTGYVQSNRIVIITGAHLCRNPRVVKEAQALGEAGYDVSVLAPLTQDELMEDDTAILEGASFRRVVSCDVRPSSGFQSTIGRGTRRLALEANRRLGLQLPEELGYGVRASLRRARAMDADYYIGHQEVGAWVCWKLMKEGRAVGADLEDWYSRDLLPENRVGRPVELLDRVEGDLVCRARHVTTTSNAMADAMAEAYGRRPEVIYNAFPWADREHMDGSRKDRLPDDRPSLFWFSQTIGPGRGLEELIDAVRSLEVRVQLHLRGNVDRAYRDSLLARLGSSSPHAIRFHSLVSPGELLSRIAEHDIGLALELREPPSRDLTITNKILQYLQGGLAVVGTDTLGQREVATTAVGAVRLCTGTPSELVTELNMLLKDVKLLKEARLAGLEAARQAFSWETQQSYLLGLVAQAPQEQAE
jgi:glycosyltransferase involved in cell wall biosynthesis